MTQFLIFAENGKPNSLDTLDLLFFFLSDNLPGSVFGFSQSWTTSSIQTKGFSYHGALRSFVIHFCVVVRTELICFECDNRYSGSIKVCAYSSYKATLPQNPTMSLRSIASSKPYIPDAGFSITMPTLLAFAEPHPRPPWPYGMRRAMCATTISLAYLWIEYGDGG